MNAPAPIRNHPNASLSAAGTVAGAVTVQALAGAGVTLTGVEQAAVYGLFSSGLLVIGRDGLNALKRDGLRGLIDALWNGTSHRKETDNAQQGPGEHKPSARPRR